MGRRASMLARSTSEESVVSKSDGKFKRGHDPRRNPGGFPKEARDLRWALKESGEDVHEALMRLVQEGNVQAVIYAHRQLVGDPKQTIDVNPAAALTDEELRRMALEVLAKDSATQPAAEGRQ